MHRIRHHPSPAGQDNVEGGEEQQLGQNQSTYRQSKGCKDFSEPIQNGGCSNNVWIFIEHNIVCFIYKWTYNWVKNGDSTVHGTWGWPGTMSDKPTMNQNLEQKLRKQWVRISTLPQTPNLFFWREFGVKKAEKLHFWKSRDPGGGSNVEIRYPQKPKIWEKWNKYVVVKKNGIACFLMPVFCF